LTGRGPGGIVSVVSNARAPNFRFSAALVLPRLRRRAPWRRAAAALAAGLLAHAALDGCAVDLGTCDETAARAVVYDGEGIPMYAGQALVSQTCGNGFCHASTARNGADPFNPDQRYGAPAGLDFDLPVATPETPDVAASLRLLQASQARVAEHAGLVWRSIDSGFMPPARVPEVSTQKFAAEGWVFARATRTDPTRALPGLDSAEGRAIARNWLACGAPVVERVNGTPRPSGAPAVGDEAPRDPFRACTGDGDCEGGKCYLALGECGPQPTWGALYASVVRSRCAVSGCHGDAVDAAGGLTLSPSDAAAARAALVGAAAASPACSALSLTRVVAGDAAASLLVQKLAGTAECGEQMPLGGPYLAPATVEAVREWVEAGAAP
jgi:hypothetical protein